MPWWLEGTIGPEAGSCESMLTDHNLRLGCSIIASTYPATQHVNDCIHWVAVILILIQTPQHCVCHTSQNPSEQAQQRLLCVRAVWASQQRTRT